MKGIVGALAKRGGLDTATSQFVDGESNSRGSFRTPDSAEYYTPPGARFVTSAGGSQDPLQSLLPMDSMQKTGAGHSQLSFSSAQTQKAIRRALLVERFTPNEHLDSLADFLESLRESLQHTHGAHG